MNLVLVNLPRSRIFVLDQKRCYSDVNTEK